MNAFMLLVLLVLVVFVPGLAGCATMRVLRWNERRIARRRARATLEAWWNDADDSRLDEIESGDGSDEGLLRESAR